jgi:hypothetical protein
LHFPITEGADIMTLGFTVVEEAVKYTVTLFRYWVAFAAALITRLWWNQTKSPGWTVASFEKEIRSVLALRNLQSAFFPKESTVPEPF